MKQWEKHWEQRHRLWREKFPQRKDAPPGGWAKYLGATWLDRAAWFPRYNLYLKSNAWRQRRQGVLFRAGHKCQICQSSERLEVHHVTYLRVGAERIEDLRCLCRSCHRSLDGTWVPLDPVTRETRKRRDELARRKAAPVKRPTRRRPAVSANNTEQSAE